MPSRPDRTNAPVGFAAICASGGESAHGHGGGVLALEPVDAWGTRVFQLRDPDGIRITISSPRTD
ncbi:MAG: hypothetical protein AVDCRST_MAG89-2998 [uncultured Gemmatimonadetes bacterium]|uniref:VOC domain-containing protein n=1 Tax=uncultured Gemmatimonadota bacterium TaxID=203437 RepID=A0A6J4M2X0_9BACT|nr:MAG: hypothetical protein AVDCRST_MAG89-2998 [uncultured Gemmatimonadota bacterium]